MAHDDEIPSVRIRAVHGLPGREAPQAKRTEVLRGEEDGHVRQAVAQGLAQATSLPAAGALLDAPAGDSNEDAALPAARALQQVRESATATVLRGWRPEGTQVSAAAERELSSGRGPGLEALKGWLAQLEIYDPAALTQLGTDLTREAGQGHPLRRRRIQLSVRTIIDGISSGRQCSFVVLGRVAAARPPSSPRWDTACASRPARSDEGWEQAPPT